MQKYVEQQVDVFLSLSQKKINVKKLTFAPFCPLQDYYIMRDMVMKTLGTASWSLLMLQIHIGLKIVCVCKIY